MAVPIQGQVGPQALPDGTAALPRLTKEGAVVTSDFAGKYYDQVVRGNAFVYSTAIAGVALVAATTSNAPFLWNPLSSGKNLVLLKVTAGRTAKGTPLEGSIAYATLASAGANIGTGAPIVSGTFVAGVNCLLGGGNASVMRFAPATVSTTGTPTLIGTAGFAQTADNGATTVSGPRAEMLVDYIDGGIIVPPGNTFQLVAAVSVSTTYTFSIWALEVPILQ